MWISFFAMISIATAQSWTSDLKSSTFTSESHSGNDTIIKKNGDRVENIQNGSWVSYNSFDFGPGVVYCWIEAATTGAGGNIEVRTGSSTGPLAGTINVIKTGSDGLYKPFPLKLSAPLSGTQNLFLKFTGGSGNLFNLGRIHFQRFTPDYVQPNGFSDWEMPVYERDLVQAIRYDDESDPGSTSTIDRDKVLLTNIKNGSWVCYKNFDFGSDSNFFWVQVDSGTGTGTAGAIEVRTDSGTAASGSLGTITIPKGLKKPVWGNLTKSVSGKKDLYLKFTGSGTGDLFDLENFYFASGVPDITKIPGSTKSVYRPIDGSSFDSQSGGVTKSSDVIQGLIGGTWTTYNDIEFGTGTNLLSIEASALNKGGTLEVRDGGSTGPLIGKINVSYTGSWTFYRPFTTMLNTSLSGKKTICFKYVDSFGEGAELFRLKNFTFGKKRAKPQGLAGNLSVYPPVPGLDPSPYYNFYVQKVSALNAEKKEDATNWMTPFAWFTECATKETLDKDGYYDNYIGGWSQTYCNFEMDRNTPIVVKITRNKTLKPPYSTEKAPSGPIFMANAYPAHRIISCELINGDVYVTMSQPAQVAIDIDGQMDTRDVPRSSPSGWGMSNNTRETGCHAVTIFANPVMNDKPKINDPDVLVVEPGQAIPDLSGSWKTLYFKPGVHDLSMNSQDAPGKWRPADALLLQNNKNYYIPGNAMVYGVMNDKNDGQSRSNIKVFGHGTLSGARIPHYSFWNNRGYNNYTFNCDGILHVRNASNCHYEGITVANPPVFGPRIEGSQNIIPNSMKWIKIITWRTNNDGHWISDGIFEDSFLRHQDDGMYLRNHPVRRCVFWTDVNGSPCRTDQLNGYTVPEVSSLRPRDSVFEDTDFVYLRCVFTTTSTGDADAAVMGEIDNGDNTYSSAVGSPYNKGQHIVFHNTRATDPRPTRNFFGFKARLVKEGNNDPDTGFVGLSGLRFSNVEFRYPQTFGWRNFLIGGPNGPLTRWYFDRTSFLGDKFDASSLGNTTRFNVSPTTKEMFFLDASVSPLEVSINTPVAFSSYSAPATVPIGVTVKGTTPVSNVQYLIDEEVVGEVNSMTYSATGLTVGMHQIQARVMDANGLAYLTRPVSFQMTGITPSKPEITTITDETTATPKLSGTATPLSLVNVYLGVTMVGKTNADASGKWSFTLAAGMSGGSYSATVITQSPEGLSPTSDPFTVNLLPTIIVTASIPNAAEPAKKGQFTFTRDGSTTDPLIVNFAVSGTATSGVDYQGLGKFVTIPAGQKSATKDVTPMDDSLKEPSETVNITVGTNGTQYLLGTKKTATVNIRDRSSYGDISQIGYWLASEGGNPAPEGANRALVVFLHAKDTTDFEEGTLKYSYQTMTKLKEIRYSIGSDYYYSAAFVLNEAGILAGIEADASAIAIATEKRKTDNSVQIPKPGPFAASWRNARTGNGTPNGTDTGNNYELDITSAFFQNVNQTTLTGASDVKSAVGATISTAPLASEVGDIVAFGAVAENNGTYVVNNGFTAGFPETDGNLGDLTAGSKLATATSETPSVTFSSSTKRQVILGVVLKKMGTTFEGWTSAYGLSGSDALMGADPDQDGITNLMEYTLGLKPKVAEPNPVDLDQETFPDGKTYLRLTVNRDPDVTNVTIHGLSTSTLTDPSSWSALTTAVEEDSATRYVVRDAVATQDAKKRFIKLKFDLNP